MAQEFETDIYYGSKAGKTTMQDVENALLSLRSSFSGTSAPTNTVGGMVWQDDSGRKVRNFANTTWLADLVGDATFKLYVYRNDVCEGWSLNAGISDCVLAFKGGSGEYNENGGTLHGTWTQPGHVLTQAEMPVHNHSTVTLNAYYAATGGVSAGTHMVRPGTVNTGNAGSGSSHNHGNTYRPYAAIGTCQYPDLT